VAVKDGEEALNVFAKQPVDVLLTDMVMPGIDGLSLLAIVKETDPSCDVVLMSAHATMTDVIAALNGGASYFFEKTRTLDELARTVERSLERRRQQLKAQELAVGLIRTSSSLAKGGSDAQRREAALSDALSLYEATLEALPSAVATVESSGRLLYVNKRFAALLGASPEDARGALVTDFVAAPDLLTGLRAAVPARVTLRAEGATVAASLVPAGPGICLLVVS
jgi:CheY-like chemotaxis protein